MRQKFNVRNNNIKASRPKRLPVQEAKRSIYTPSLRLQILKGIPCLAYVHTPPSLQEKSEVGSVPRLYPVQRHISTHRGGGEVNATGTGCPLPVLTLLLFRYHHVTISLLFNFAASHFLEAKVLEVPSLMALL